MTQPGEIDGHAASEKDLLPVIISTAHVLLKLLKQEPSEFGGIEVIEKQGEKLNNVKSQVKY